MAEYISREDLVKAIEADFNKDWGERGTNGDWDYIDGARDEYDDVLKIVCGMKASDVQPIRHGRWIPQGNDMWLCSNCKENIIYSMHKSDRAEKQRYCSRCGARMDIVYQDDKVTATKVTGW